ncbi:ROK family protein [Thermopirellula anaerolimosa]
MVRRTQATEKRIVAVDIGGTKILAAVGDPCGTIYGRDRCSTPRDCGSLEIFHAVESAVLAAIKKAGLRPRHIAGMAVGIPGVVDYEHGRIVKTPNMPLTEAPLREFLFERFGVPIVLENDCNLGALGEAWLGAGRHCRSVFGVFVGTGIGSGFVRKRKLWRGARYSAGEIGHMVMQIGGPVCGCGNAGCLEALAGRTAIERDIREAVARGEATVLTELLGGDLSVVRSRALRAALSAGDSLVTRVLERAADILGAACLSVRHLLDPQRIVLGGGVMEACGDFLMPRIRAVLDADQMRLTKDPDEVCLSQLGDYAVIVGGMALAARLCGANPLKKYPDAELRVLTSSKRKPSNPQNESNTRNKAT